MTLDRRIGKLEDAVRNREKMRERAEISLNNLGDLSGHPYENGAFSTIFKEIKESGEVLTIWLVRRTIPIEGRPYAWDHKKVLLDQRETCDPFRAIYIPVSIKEIAKMRVNYLEKGG